MDINRFAGILLNQLRTRHELSTIDLWRQCRSDTISVILLFDTLEFLERFGLAARTRKAHYKTFYRITAYGLRVLAHEITGK